MKSTKHIRTNSLYWKCLKKQILEVYFNTLNDAEYCLHDEAPLNVSVIMQS